MRSILFCAAMLFTGIASTQAQLNCANGRYQDAIFSNVKVTSAVLFGSAEQLVDAAGPDYDPVLMNQDLYMDIYEPEGDVEINRPAIVMAFGGAFVFGTRTDSYMVDLCTRYAKLGYVVASIDYRLSRELTLKAVTNNDTVAPRAVLKGAHDMKAAIRFMRKSAVADGNPYGIDPDKIYTGGLSAGAFCALHAAYLDRMEEVPEILQEYAQQHGGIEGLSGNEGYSSAVSGVISFSGALGDSIWLEEGNVPLVSTHGTADAVVPYGSDSVTILSINYPVDGSHSIHQRADHVGVLNALYTYYGAGHAMESSDEAYRDTGFNFTKNFMYQLVCNQTSDIVAKKAESIQVYPNPTRSTFSIPGVAMPSKVELLDIRGAVLKSFAGANLAGEQFSVSDIAPGMYIVRVKAEQGLYTAKLSVE